MSNPADNSPEATPLTALVERAQSGLRRDVQAFMEGLDACELLIPLARDLPEAPEGERIELTGELVLLPHLLPDENGRPFAALFTYPDPLEPIVDALGWQTDGEALKVCAFPARIALEMALQVLNDDDVGGLVIDAGAASELCLTRAELGSLLAGRALPLVGYVANIPEHEQERTLVAENEPAPAEFTAALARFFEQHTEVTQERLERTFNPDRDLEPHWTLTLRVPSNADRKLIFEQVTREIDGTLPPPGYLDVLFEDAAN